MGVNNQSTTINNKTKNYQQRNAHMQQQKNREKNKTLLLSIGKSI